MSKFGRKLKQPPPGFEYVEPTLTALENELRERVNDPHEGLRKTESQWPVHQINWQKSRYIYDLYYTYHRISREVYDYCITNKIVDAALIAKWKKPGYERLCSTYAINPRNYKFGTVSICRVPKHCLPPGTEIEDPNTGCRGCASGSGGNIFGNKYGQYLAAIQIAREERAARLAQEKAEDDDEEDEENHDNDDEGDKEVRRVEKKEQSKKAMRQEKHRGPVGAADGSSGEVESVWVSAEDDVQLDESMIGHLTGDAEAESRSAARAFGSGGGGGKGRANDDVGHYGPPGKKQKY